MDLLRMSCERREILGGLVESDYCLKRAIDIYAFNLFQYHRMDGWNSSHARFSPRTLRLESLSSKPLLRVVLSRQEQVRYFENECIPKQRAHLDGGRVVVVLECGLARGKEGEWPYSATGWFASSRALPRATLRFFSMQPILDLEGNFRTTSGQLAARDGMHDRSIARFGIYERSVFYRLFGIGDIIVQCLNLAIEKVIASPLFEWLIKFIV